MTGAPTWEQIIWLVGLIGMVSLGAFALAWRIAELRREDRHSMASVFEQKVVSLDQAMELQLTALEKRLDSVEDFRTSTSVVLAHMEKFHLDVSKRFDELHAKREQDMQAIHNRLNAIFNRSQLDG
jgi:hypothetical protein